MGEIYSYIKHHQRTQKPLRVENRAHRETQPTWCERGAVAGGRAGDHTLDNGLLKREKIKLMLCCSVAESCPTLCDAMDGSTPGSPVHHHLPELAQTHVHQVGDAIQPSHLLSPLLLLPSLFPSIRVFSNESALPISRLIPKYWSISLNIIQMR